MPSRIRRQARSNRRGPSSSLSAGAIVRTRASSSTYSDSVSCANGCIVGWDSTPRE
jgi:hypothetical protein